MNGRAKGGKIRVNSVEHLWRLQSSGRKQAPLQSKSGRVASPPDAGGLSAQDGVFFENLFNASTTSTANGSRGASSDYGVNGSGKQSAVLPAAESRRLAEHIPGPKRSRTLEGLTGGEERRRPAVAPLGMMSVKYVLNIALCAKEEAILEDAFIVDREVWVEMLSGDVNNLPPPPTTHSEVEGPPSRKTFECSQNVELNGLLGVGCFKVIDINKAVPRGRKIVGSRWVHIAMKVTSWVITSRLNHRWLRRGSHKCRTWTIMRQHLLHLHRLL